MDLSPGKVMLPVRAEAGEIGCCIDLQLFPIPNQAASSFGYQGRAPNTSVGGEISNKQACVGAEHPRQFSRLFGADFPFPVQGFIHMAALAEDREQVRGSLA